jgi:hypothetical protein
MTRDMVEAGCELVFGEDDEIPNEEECRSCGCPVEDGECYNCGRADQTEQQWDYLRHLSPSDRRAEEAYWTARGKGWND